MVHKKVGTITLEYDRGDGVKVSEAFQGEFNNAIFRGNISMLEGTFEGSLTANAVNAVKNLNIKGGAVAITTVSTIREVSRRTGFHFNDDAVWRSIHTLTIETPPDSSGGWLAAGIQYLIDDQKRDNGMFPCQMRIIIDGRVVYTSPAWSLFSYYYVIHKHFFHEVVERVSSARYHTVTLQYRWDEYPTNVYPEFYDVVIRADYFRR